MNLSRMQQLITDPEVLVLYHQYWATVANPGAQ
jgi:hypothetical protein